MEGILICSGCGYEFDWEAGNEVKGNIYHCEVDECENFICATCLDELGIDINDDIIRCLHCDKK